MDFSSLFSFLEQLQRNNHKEWMDAHRKEYLKIREDYILWLEHLDQLIAQHTSDYTQVDLRKSLNRINNNLLFHPNKPVYKDHFGAGLDQAYDKQGDFYIQIGVHESFLAGGYWKPKKEFLSSIRDAIDYNGEQLQEIIDRPSFKKNFDLIKQDQLKTAPRGYSTSHKHIELLRLRSYAVIHPLSREDVLSPDFMDRCLQVFIEMKPFRDYLNQAVSV